MQSPLSVHYLPTERKMNKVKRLGHTKSGQNSKMNTIFSILTFLAMKSTISKAPIKHPAAILAVRRFVEASTRAIPQNDEPRSGTTKMKKLFDEPKGTRVQIQHKTDE